MLKSVSFENYKCFKARTTIELAPLTLLCGVNSSGKSSIINSLLMLKQSYENSAIENKMELNGKYIKSGSFDDIIFKGENGKITFQTCYELAAPPRGGIKKSKNDITAFKTLAKMFAGVVDNITSFVVSTKTVIDKMADSKQINNNILDEQIIEIKANSNENVMSTTSIILRHNQDKKYRIEVQNMPHEGRIESKVIFYDCACYFEGFKLVNAFANGVEPRVDNFGGILADIYLIFSLNSMQYRSIHYLNPLREYPKMNYNIDNEINSVGLGGEYAPHLIYLNQNKRINGFFPPNEDGEFFVQEKKIDFKNCVQNWMEYLGFGHYLLEKKSQTLNMLIDNYNIINVGFGISQVLPIIAEGLLLEGRETLLLEQPEIHLHPKAQMCMADFLLATAINSRNVIVETHSDHIINRVIRRMMENPQVYNKVKILFVDQNEEGESFIEEVKIDPVKGALIENENFFYQFADETEKIIAAGYRNKKNAQESRMEE